MDNNNLDMAENLGSSWDDFFGPSSDLVPTLMSIFDTMIGKPAQENPLQHPDANSNDQLEGHPRSPALAIRNLNHSCTGYRLHFPLLRIVEPGDELDESLLTCSSSSAGTKANATRRCASFRSTVDHKVSDPCKKRLLCDERPKSTSSTTTSMTSSSSACSSASASSLMSSTAGTCLASVESLADSALGRGGGSEVSSSDLSQVTGEEMTGQTWRGQQRSNNNDLFTHSADSGDSGVSSPGPSSDASSSSQKNEAADTDLSYMDRVVMEVVESESVYVKDLEQVVQGYLHHWRHEGNTAPLSREQSNCLFGNVEDIHTFSAEFLEQLQMCGRDPVEVARCFVRNNTGFTIYTDYCTNYPRSVSVLTELMRNETAGRTFRDRQTQLGHPLPLGSYLLKPVQRILKYHLLLQNIVKHYERTAPGYSDIIVALSAMTGIAHHINDMKRRHEHAVRVQEVQSLLYGWPGEDLTTYGELVAEGSFRMYGAKAPRHVFLLDKMLLVCKKKEDGALGYKTHILCSNLMLIESVPGEPLSFHVIPFDNPRLQYTLEARNMEQKREWTLQLKRVILENYDAVIPLHARQLVLQLGQERCERQATLERTATKRQHSAPEYLERRKNSSAGIKNRVRKSRKNDATSPRESPLLPRRFRRSLDHSRDRSMSRDRISSTDENTPTRKQSTESCPATVEKRQDFEWSNCDVSSSQADLGSFSIPEEESSVTETVETAHLEVKPESLEHIVEQLVLQNVEIKRILERKKRRDARLKSQLQESNANNEVHIPESSEETRFPRCPTRRSLDSHPNKSESTAKQKTEGENRSPAVNRSLSCPARQAVRIVKKSETSPTSGNVSNKLNKVINQLGSPEQWPSWIRSLSPTSRKAENADQTKVADHADENPSPCIPSVWLRMQSEHLAEPAKKSGSLPRSFQVHQEGKARWSDRPITIASDCPTSIGLKGDSVDFYLNCEPGSQPSVFSSSTLDNNSLTDFTATPRVSAENIHFHPDHKIYRRSSSRASLRSVLTTVSAKLSHFKSGSEFWGSLFNVTNDQSRQANNNKLLHYLSRQYTSLLKQRTRFSPRSGIGSATVAARMAKENDYAVPKFCASKSDLTKSSTSLVSKGTLWESLEAEAFTYFDSDSQSESDRDETLSIDSFYEHSFEAIEEFLDSDWCYRESILFTEREDLNTASSVSRPQEKDTPRQKLPPPPVPRKPARTLAVLDRIRILDDQKHFCAELNKESSSLENLKSIDQRRKELERQNAVTMVTKNGDESETSSQHSTSTVNTVVELHPTMAEEPTLVEAAPTVPKGWVKYVIGKLQGDGK